MLDSSSKTRAIRALLVFLAVLVLSVLWLVVLTT